MYKRIHDTGMGAYHSRLALALRTLGRGFHVRGGIDPGGQRVHPRFVTVAEEWKHF